MIPPFCAGELKINRQRLFVGQQVMNFLVRLIGETVHPARQQQVLLHRKLLDLLTEFFYVHLHYIVNHSFTPFFPRAAYCLATRSQNFLSLSCSLKRESCFFSSSLQKSAGPAASTLQKSAGPAASTLSCPACCAAPAAGPAVFPAGPAPLPAVSAAPGCWSPAHARGRCPHPTAQSGC